MLFAEDVAKDAGNGIVRSGLVKHLEVSLLRCEIVNAGIDIAYALLVKLALSRKDSLRRGREQDVVVQRGDEEPAPHIQKPGRKVDARATAVAYDVREVAVEYHQTRDAGLGLDLCEVSEYIVHRVIPETCQRGQHSGLATTVRIAVIAVDILLDASRMCHLAKIAEKGRTEVIVSMGRGKNVAETLDGTVYDGGLAGAIRPGEAN